MYAKITLVLVGAVIGTPLFAQMPSSLTQMSDVKDALKLDQKQDDRLSELTAEMQSRYRDDYAALKNVNEVDRLTRQRELDQKYYAEFNKAARKVMNDAQYKQYQNCFYQQQGFKAFYNADLQSKMGMTRDQVASLKQQASFSDLQMKAIQATAAKDSAKAQRDYADYMKQRDDRIQRFLNEDQKKMWRDMTGEPFAFHPSFGAGR